MTQKLDYSREDAMEILNNVNFSDEEKRSQYEEYMSELKKTRKNAIVTKLNDLAREIPTITKDIYISVLKKYDNESMTFDDTIFDAPKVEEKEDEEELKPSFSLTSEMSVLNEEPELLAKPLFNEEDDSMEVMPEENDSEKGNSSAIIISIIAVIIGAVVMYSIIRLN